MLTIRHGFAVLGHGVHVGVIRKTGLRVVIEDRDL